jgi:hypothetical protein
VGALFSARKFGGKIDVLLRAAVVTYGKSEKTAILTQNFRRKLFKVSTADEITCVNTFNRTYVVANAAAGTLFVVNCCKVIFNLDSSRRTGFLALSASNTTVGANLTHLSTLVMAGAFHNYTRGIIYKAYDSVGTFLYAKAATDTLSGVYLGNISVVIYADSVSRTNLNAITVSKTSEGAVAVAGVIHIRRNTAFRAVVNIFSFRRKAGAVTSNVSNLLNYVCRFKTHYFRNVFCYSVTAGNTKARVVGFPLGNCLCISVASGITASTAIGTGKAVTHSGGLLIFLYSEKGGRNGENKRTYDSDAEKDENRY